MSTLKIFREGNKVVIANSKNDDAIAIDESKVSWSKDKVNPLSVYIIYEHPVERHQVQERFLITEIIDEDDDPYADNYDDLTEALSKKLD